MAIIAKDSGSRDYEKIPEGLWSAVCDMIVDLGMQNTTWKGKSREKHQVYIRWQLPDHQIEYTKDEKELSGPMVAGRIYTLSLNERSALRHDLEKWRGRPFTDEELKGFDLAKVLGKPCRVLIEHSQSQDGSRTYVNVAKVMKYEASDDMAPPEVEDEAIIYDSDNRGNLLKLPKWLQEKLGVDIEPEDEEPTHPAEADDCPF